MLAFFLEFFSGGGKIYCYANFFCYAIVFGPNFRGETASGGHPPFPLWKKARMLLLVFLFVSGKLPFQVNVFLKVVQKGVFYCIENHMGEGVLNFLWLRQVLKNLKIIL